MLDFINNHFMTFTLYVALLIEKTGVMHISYLIQYFFYWLAGKKIETNEPPRSPAQAAFFWGRCVWSLTILAFSFVVTLKALFDGKTTMWEKVPNGVAVVLFFVLMSIAGILEGMQIAFFAVAKLQKSERGTHPMAMKTCELLFRGEGRNLPGFMVGRQMCVTLCFFVIARVTTLDAEVGIGQNIFGVSDTTQRLFNTGLLGAIITTILGSIAWQLVAGAFPLQFLSNPLVYVVLRWCLFLESTGICAGAWFLAMINKRIVGFQFDEVYIGTPEERAAMDKADLSSARGDSVAEPHLGTNILNPAPGAKKLPEEWRSLGPLHHSFTARRTEVLGNIRTLREQVEQALSEDERQTMQSALDHEIEELKDLNKEQVTVMEGGSPEGDDLESDFEMVSHCEEA